MGVCKSCFGCHKTALFLSRDKGYRGCCYGKFYNFNVPLACICETVDMTLVFGLDEKNSSSLTTKNKFSLTSIHYIQFILTKTVCPGEESFLIVIKDTQSFSLSLPPSHSLSLLPLTSNVKRFFR